MTIGTVVVLSFVSPLLAVTIGIVIAAGAAATLAQANGVRSTTRGARRRRARLAGNVTEKINAVAVAVVQAHGAVVEQCELTELVASLPDGLDTRVNEGGRDLSSGQRQRVLLARALLGAPRVLLLDEAAANLDPSTSAVVDRVLRRFEGTALVITHRRERLAVADAIWHLDDGRLVHSGPAAAALDADGPTAQLFADTDELVGER